MNAPDEGRQAVDPREKIRRAEDQFRETDRDTPHVIQLDERDRSWIARGVVHMFVIAIIAVLAIYLIEGLTTRDWHEVAAQASDLIRADVLPVVTLILGYYFGRSGRI